ncbi:VWA domain-containing protein [Actinomycetospora sp. TBRC 11914]|uniref:VWA domain-containing protein n=1 Tax=Actinomycetospora sp. TBRC 11914 TaxID=2729387 RepID=UPI00145EB642|nr:VWA domain-containing protein [Actinomycetospora sp. TBRC 11914]NMO89976.1 VWA domain-containing protein [Actinomycetospora sp. TBRC 11914]
MAFPFSAVVGHPDLRLALLLAAVDPGIGGVLVRGEKGTAKSTIVRALADLLPEVTVRAGDRFGVDVDAGEESPDGPFAAGTPVERRPARLVELPVGASEDRLIGSLDLQEVLAHGRGSVQPGLLAAAHRGVLYVDEVNLLHDHLVDLLLDAAASGRSHVERDGISFSHPARFLLVGTMNPEEGELRPQLLDRFGLTVAVTASREVAERTEVVRRRLAHDADPAGFAARFAGAEDALRARLGEARDRLPRVALSDRELVRISAVCAAVEVDGMRADVVLARTAVAHAAWRGVGAVDVDDVRAAARLALPHRRRRDPFDEPSLSEEELEKALQAAEQAVADHDDDQPPDPPSGGGGPDDGPEGPDDGRGPDGADPAGGADGPGPDEDGDGSEAGAGGRGQTGSEGHGSAGPPSSGARDDGDSLPLDAGNDAPLAQGLAQGAAGDEPAGRPVGAPTPTRLRTRRFEVHGLGDGAPGRRSRSRGRRGRTVRAVVETPDTGPAPHLPATVLAAARGGRRGRAAPEDLRHALREGREGNLVLFCVDASGSMAARRRMNAVAGAVVALLRDAYQRRDKVGVVTFRGPGATVVLPPTTSVHTAHHRLADLRTGGRTPLADGLRTARRVLRAERVRDPRRRGLLIVLTDGRATVSSGSGSAGATPLVEALEAARGLAREAGPGRRRAGSGGAAMSTVVVDCESGPVRLGLAGRVAGAAAGAVVTLDELTGDSVAAVAQAM